VHREEGSHPGKHGFPDSIFEVLQSGIRSGLEEIGLQALLFAKVIELFPTALVQLAFENFRRNQASE
jgi:hypothetical protein